MLFSDPATAKTVTVILIKTGDPAHFFLVNQIGCQRFHLLEIAGPNIYDLFIKGIA
jgi:hypothetical protein